MFEEFIVLFLLVYCSRFDSIVTASNKSIYLDETIFMSLENYQVNAKPVTEAQYPWIARVVHSASENLPHMCTAVCVDNRIFITAARCIYSLKIKYTGLIYQNIKIPALAFVLPSKPSKQAFDDIGFIVVQRQNTLPLWHKVSLYNKKRTDNAFQWFADTTFKNYKVIGYATQKGIHRIKSTDRLFDLTDLPVIINIKLCTRIMTFFDQITGFRVPCYHSCEVDEFIKRDPKCSSYHGVEGGAVVSVDDGILLGIATWGAYFPKYELPVGFSVINSNNFYSDFECAKRIRNIGVMNGGYQGICE